MRCKFPERDLSQRLDSTVCRYKGFPYWVRCVNRGVISLYSLSSGGKKCLYEINPSDIDFDISTVPLGYVQITQDIVVYMSRRPNRLYKQGLSADACSYKFTPGNNFKVNATFFNQAFEKMVCGEYPDLRDVLHNLRKSEVEKEVAISRDIALKYNPNLKIIVIYFKGEDNEVGWIVPDTNIVIVPSSEKGWVVSNHLLGFSWEIR